MSDDNRGGRARRSQPPSEERSANARWGVKFSRSTSSRSGARSSSPAEGFTEPPERARQRRADSGDDESDNSDADDESDSNGVGPAVSLRRGGHVRRSTRKARQSNDKDDDDDDDAEDENEQDQADDDDDDDDDHDDDNGADARGDEDYEEMEDEEETAKRPDLPRARLGHRKKLSKEADHGADSGGGSDAAEGGERRRGRRDGKRAAARVASGHEGTAGQGEEEDNDDTNDQATVPSEDGFTDELEDDDEEARMLTSSTRPLTSRQRAIRDGGSSDMSVLMFGADALMQGGDDAENAQRRLVAEKRALKRQQQARLRRITHEKRSEEKRSATIEKVLRGVTGKRRRQTQEAEQLAVERENKQQENQKDSVRYLSRGNDLFVVFPEEYDLPDVLDQPPLKYPEPVARDPRTGKRLPVDAAARS